MHLRHKCALVFVQNFVPVLIRIDLFLVSVFVILKLELHVCSVRLSKRSWVVLSKKTSCYVLHHLIGPLNIIDQSYCTTHSSHVPVLLSIWQKPRGMKLYEALKEGKLSSNTSGSAPDTAITDNHETDPREKGRDLTQSYDNLTTQKRHQKLWLHNNLGQT